MLRILLIGAGTMTVFLLLQSALLVQALRYYSRRHDRLTAEAPSWSTLLVINGVLMIGVSTAALLATFQNAIKSTGQAGRGAGN